jgi:hypothetical protein
MRRPLLATLAVCFALTAGACASRADDGPLAAPESTSTSVDDSSTVPTSPSDTTTDECRPGDLDPTDLEPLMLAERDGFDLEPDDVGDTGPSDLAKAISDDEQPDAAAVMQELGFRRGYQRYWTNSAGGGLVVFVYEFCDGLGAVGYGNRVFDFVDGLTPFEVVGATGARGISGTRDGALVAYASRVAGPTLVLTVASGPEGTVLLREVQSRATALLADQIAALG